MTVVTGGALECGTEISIKRLVADPAAVSLCSNCQTSRRGRITQPSLAIFGCNQWKNKKNTPPDHSRRRFAI